MYSVRWAPEALDELATLWAGAAPEDRALITDATDEIDRVLARDPLSAGESREAEFRVLIVLPIAVQFRVWEDERTAIVVNVWRFRSNG